ncbi:MAG TPA: hypothetical protein DCW29_10305 [Janthinobacterium sp.]|nr:hypothetical protein [Janthinobacterium sp.]
MVVTAFFALLAVTTRAEISLHYSVAGRFLSGTAKFAAAEMAARLLTLSDGFYIIIVQLLFV